MKMNRSGKVGLTATIILMFSIVLFVGSLFWLYINGPWAGAGNNLFNPYPNSSPKDIDVNTSTTQTENISLLDALNDLREAGVSCMSYNETIDISKAIEVKYQEFREIAIDRQVALIVSIEDKECLLTYQDNKKIIWTP